MHTARMASSKQIKSIRKKLGENQTAFAARFGVDQATLSRWETKGIPERGATRIAVEVLLEKMKIEERLA